MDAYRVFRELKGLPWNINSRTKFEKYLGISGTLLSDKIEYWAIEPTTYKRLNNLLGPHAATLLKAYEAEHGPL